MSKDTLPSVGILTVVFNDLVGLKATCSAVQALEYPKLTHWVIDGASTDGTADWLRQQEQPRIRWISEPDSGLYDAMNKGLAQSEEEFVWFLNAGDLPADPLVLKRVFSAHPEEDVLYGDTELMDAQGVARGLRRHKPLPRRLSRNSLRLGMVVSHQSMLVRRSLAPRFDLRYCIAADIDWTIRLLTRTDRTKNIRGVLSRFELGGTSSQHRLRSLRERWRILSRHFGLGAALAAHAEILLRALGRIVFRLPV